MARKGLNGLGEEIFYSEDLYALMDVERGRWLCVDGYVANLGYINLRFFPSYKEAEKYRLDCLDDPQEFKVRKVNLIQQVID